MDAAQALADLTEISSQLVQVAILDRDGSLLASTISEPEPATHFVAGLGRLLEEADRQAPGGAPLVQIDAATREGSVFAIRSDGRVIGATTRADPTVGLVLYDLRRCLESVGEIGEPDARGEHASAAPPAETDPGTRGAEAEREADRPA